MAEVLSPSTERTDLVTKRLEYATAAIPHYLLIDVRERPTLRHLHNPSDGDYRNEAEGASVTLHLAGHGITIRAKDLII